jgi:hypothetical protein
VIPEEHNRLKSLLIATTFTYGLSWVIALLMQRMLNSLNTIWFVIDNMWITAVLGLLAFAYIPLTGFLFFQGVKMRKMYANTNFEGDRTIGNLSLAIPVGILFIYIATRVVN